MFVVTALEAHDAGLFGISSAPMRDALANMVR